MIRTVFATLLLAGGGFCATAAAAPVEYDLPAPVTTLRPGLGMETAQTNCLACHSTDYIQMQPPKKGAAFWGAEVTKMVKVYGAPISDADAKTITDYLATAY